MPLSNASTPSDASACVPQADLVPTRELAMQVAEAVHRYGRPFGTSVLHIMEARASGNSSACSSEASMSSSPRRAGHSITSAVGLCG